MNITKYIIVAILQGITEPLPISSSGHMRLFENIFNHFTSDLNFEIFCNFGSFLAILFIFKKDVIIIVKDFFKYIFKKGKKSKKNFDLTIKMIISTIPPAICGFLLKDIIDKTLNKPIILGFSFLITALILFLIRNKNGNKKIIDLTIKDAIIIGLVQMITIIPGISRSGTVLSICLFLNMDKESSIKYTFLLYFPISFGSMLLGVNDVLQNPNLYSLFTPYCIGLVVSLFITYFSYSWMNNWVKKGKLVYFSIYCLIIAAFIFIYFR